jgi:hypothetical protein
MNCSANAGVNFLKAESFYSTQLFTLALLCRPKELLEVCFTEMERLEEESKSPAG